ncbi:DivIVA domain-containing protein [Phormidium sp. CCY1219]|uniref:DivIVA domain-containing protein n=1 Tax=Phormidium sp. CCY1219 TaxID=2886104 RepID=UPI002D1F2EA6|nr:DivIVA domain-containing protein [Phormidium sp. CCY1219]MEB3829046.1 DivIVA domain-containing protein [Phormidium sp. CCY1219]
MLRQDSARIDPEDRSSIPEESSDTGAGSLDIQRELNRLEEMILDSPRIPLTGRTLVDEEQLLEHLDLLRLNLPGAFQEVEEIIRHKDEIIVQAEQYAQEILDAAEQRANQILDEMGIVRQAKLEADRLRQQVQLDCEAAQEQTISEIENLRRQAQQELDEMRARAIAQAEGIERGADEYADSVLQNLESQLGEMLRVIQNGRAQLDRNPGGGSAPPSSGSYPER